MVAKESWHFALYIDKQLNNVDFPTGNPTILLSYILVYKQFPAKGFF
jgi:hypothetical protein